jgi:hypothetical protein
MLIDRKKKRMRKYLIYIIIISILTKKSMSIKCLNNNCECNQLEDNKTYDVECTSQSVTNDVQMIDIQTINNLKITNNKESIDLILNELTTIEIKSLDLSFNKLDNNINIEIKSIIKLNLSNNRKVY